jgi:thiol-disulfide isomerase/thioredoxin
MEAFISRISAEGPSAKRPPHMLLELPVRLLIALLLSVSLAGCDRQKAEAPQGGAAGGKIEAGVIDRSRAGTPAPDTPFENPGGETVSFAEFQGKPLLVNLWATWCAPCVVEMPTLDRLAQREGERLQVLTVSMDMNGHDKVRSFFAERDFKAIESHIDPKADLMFALEATVLPTTILYDAEGREMWRMVGPEELDGERVREILGELR